MQLYATVSVQGHKIKALVDSGAARTVISPQTVEKYELLYRVKKNPILIILADEKPIEYRNGIIQLETKLTTLQVANTEC